MNTLDGRIKQVMSIILEVAIEDITDDSSQDTIGSWDSLKHLNLILALEEEFEISIPDEEVGNMINFRLIQLIINESKK
jgi:acyl carrier protein